MNLLTEKEVAAMLQLNPDTLRAWRCRKQGPKFVKVGSNVRYRLEDLEAYLVSRETDPRATSGWLLAVPC